MEPKHVLRRLMVGMFGLGAVVLVGVVRVLPLLAEGPEHPNGDKKDGGKDEKKDEKKDKKKKGTGPRTQNKKAKKGKA